MEEDWGASWEVEPPKVAKKVFLAELEIRDEDRSPSPSRQASMEIAENDPIWALEVVSTRGELLGALIIRGTGLSAFTANEILYE